MALPKNIDRYMVDEAWDLEPLKIWNIFQSANGGEVKRQSRLANELTEKDPAIGQAWSVRVAGIAACPWEVVGGEADQNEFIAKSLRNIQPNYNDNLVSFNKLLQFLQSSVLHGFALSRTDWGNGGSVINGFELYSQSLFSFSNSKLPYYQGPDGDKKIFPKLPAWIYHTATNSRDAEPLRSGIVRPLAYLYAFRRHIQIEYLRGLEKYGLPLPFVGVEGLLYDDDNTKKQDVQNFLLDWTYDGYAMFDKDAMEMHFPTADSGFDVNNFLSYLEWTEKQIFRLILGQDSTSSSDNSNRSTAQVHNLVRADMLASDAKAVEETVNTQIIKPLFENTFGISNNRPRFRFRLKGTAELQEMANVVKTLYDSGKTVNNEVLSERFGLPIEDINTGSEDGSN